MKKIFENIFKSLLVLAVLFTNLSNIQAESKEDVENVIIDGDFEEGGAAWDKRNRGEIAEGVSYGEGSKAGVVPSSAIDDEGRANGYIGQVIALEPHTDYHVSAYAKVDVEGAQAAFTGRWWNQYEREVIHHNGAPVDQAVNSTEWTKLEYSFNSGEQKYALIQLVKWSMAEETKQANAYIDNVVVVKGESHAPETPEEPAKPQLKYNEVWRDDFDQETLNMDDWGYELGLIRGTEHQHYVNDEENVFLRDGKLVLRATDRAEEDQYTHPRDPKRRVIYNSGSIRTHGKREFLYGKLEIRAKLPKGQAVFPAFWTLGADFTLDGQINGKQGHGWPITGEIDIMELIGGKVDGDYDNRTVYQTVHYGPREDDVGRFSGNGTSYTIPKGNFNDEFHTFALDWHEDRMDWYVDDQLVRSVPYAEDPMAKDIFSKPQYIQLNLAMGGAWPGHVGENLAGTEFVVDYVSYSQTEEQAKAAQEYYKTAPKLEGVEALTMYRGQDFNPLENVTTIENYFVDFSINDAPMFDHRGGNVNVQLLVKGKDEMDKISELPAGTYNIHYSALPEGVTLSEDRAAKVARKSTTLTILPNSLDEDLSYTVKKGTALKDIELPEGWNWVDETAIVEEDQKFEAYYQDLETGERSEVQVFVEKVDYDALDAKIKEAKALLDDESYTLDSRELLGQSLALIESIREAELTQSQVDKSIEYLDYIIKRLEKVVEEKPGNENSGNENTDNENIVQENTGNKKPGNNHSNNENLEQQKPSNEKPLEEKPVEDKQVEEKPVGEKPVGEKTAEKETVKEDLPQTGMASMTVNKGLGLSFLFAGIAFVLKKKD